MMDLENDLPLQDYIHNHHVPDMEFVKRLTRAGRVAQPTAALQPGCKEMER